MKRHAYIQHVGSALVINTLFAGPKRFPLSELKEGEVIDLVKLKKTSPLGELSFYLLCEPSFFLSNDPTLPVFCVTNEHGRIERVGEIETGEAKSFSCFVP